MRQFSLPKWPYAFGSPQTTGEIKAQVDDFFVKEILSFTPEGNGEHAFLCIEKCGENTEYVARLLSRHAGVRQRDVSFAGLKDRHGRTQQWFSVWLPGKPDPDWHALNSENLTILHVVRHARKLKRGVLAGNEFKLVIRNWQGDKSICEQQLRAIQHDGFPNYYAEQRFGHHGQNVEKALALFQGATGIKREQRSIYLSAARSYLFNLVLAERVINHTWKTGLSGDVFKLNNTNSHFSSDTIDTALLARLNSGDIHPTGVLWGKGESGARSDTLALEQHIISSHPLLANGLLKEGLESDRRALRVIPENLLWQFNDDSLELSFRLPAGSYATALLREIIATEN